MSILSVNIDLEFDLCWVSQLKLFNGSRRLPKVLHKSRSTKKGGKTDPIYFPNHFSWMCGVFSVSCQSGISKNMLKVCILNRSSYSGSLIPGGSRGRQPCRALALQSPWRRRSDTTGAVRWGRVIRHAESARISSGCQSQTLLTGAACTVRGCPRFFLSSTVSISQKSLGNLVFHTSTGALSCISEWSNRL